MYYMSFVDQPQLAVVSEMVCVQPRRQYPSEFPGVAYFTQNYLPHYEATSS